jgi:hypothetical protein
MRIGHIRVSVQKSFISETRAPDYSELAFADEPPESIAEALASLEQRLRM